MRELRSTHQRDINKVQTSQSSTQGKGKIIIAITSWGKMGSWLLRALTFLSGEGSSNILGSWS